MSYILFLFGFKPVNNQKTKKKIKRIYYILTSSVNLLITYNFQNAAVYKLQSTASKYGIVFFFTTCYYFTTKSPDVQASSCYVVLHT